MSIRRVQKVSELLSQQLSELINQDFSERYGVISVTAVDITEDLKEAIVFISAFEKASERELINDLSVKAKNYQRILGDRLKMKYTPKLQFVLDKGLEKVNRIEKLLDDINKK